VSAERDWEEMEYRVEKISVDKIDMGRFQSRTVKVEEGLEDLAENIGKLGLINPITIYKMPSERYELIAGQRRFMAIKDILCWEKIPARILPFEPTEIVAKAISYSENVMRNKLASIDRVASIRLLYLRCGASGREITRTTGIPYELVLDVIGYEGLSQGLKDKVDSGEIDVDLAKRAMKATIAAYGTVDEEKSVNIASIMKTLLPIQQQNLAKITAERPEASIEELADEARKIPPTKQIRIYMLMPAYDGLSKYSESEGIKEGEAAGRIILQSLKDMGYLT